MNAMNLYIRTCRQIVQSNNEDHLGDIDHMLSCLRQALSCCVCGRLLIIPMSSTTSSCQHPVCKSCVGGKMKIKPSCSWCKDYRQYGENINLRILLQLYKKLCEYCVTIALPRRFADLNGSTNVNLAELIEEGVALQDSYEYKEVTKCLPKSTIDGVTDLHIPVPPPHTLNGESKDVSNGVYSVTVSEDNSNKIMIKRTSAETNDNETPNKKLKHSFRIPKSRLKKRGCRCGLATPNPGKLTCCGQRCPCYVENKACNECRCRGCRNPHKLELNESEILPKAESSGILQDNEDISDVEIDTN